MIKEVCYCDRCKKEIHRWPDKRGLSESKRFKSVGVGLSDFSEKEDGEVSRFDLCAKCRDDLLIFLKGD